MRNIDDSFQGGHNLWEEVGSTIVPNHAAGGENARRLPAVAHPV
jgi:hypothetical protein